MSHITNVRLRVKNLDALAKASTELGLELKQGQKTFRVHEGPRPCEHAIVVPGNANAHQIGLVAVTAKNAIAIADGSPVEAGAGWDLLFDGWGSNGAALTSKTGANLTKIRQGYSAEVAMERASKTLARQGFVATRTMLESGIMRVRLVQR